MMTRTLLIEQTYRTSSVLKVEECPVCFILYAVPDSLIERRHDEGGSWYCPNGDSICFTTPKLAAEQKRSAALADEGDRLRRDNLRLSDDLMDKAKELRRIKRRTQAGVCSLCNRHFENVERHYKTKHPDCAYK